MRPRTIHHVVAFVFSLGLGLGVAIIHFATALGALNWSQTARGLGFAFAVVIVGFATLTVLFAFRSLRKLLLITALGPVAILDAYLSLQSRVGFTWLAVFAATAFVAVFSVLLSGRLYDRRHPNQA